MPVTYPLSLPTNVGIANITLMAKQAVAVTSSPFTFQQQIFKHPGEAWEASVSLPPMLRDDAANWVAFLVSLKGQFGTFLLGDPNCRTVRGAVGSATVLINLARTPGQDTLSLKGLPINTTGVFEPMDYIQLGSGSTATLHMVLSRASSNASGITVVDIWPAVKRNVAVNEAVVYTNTVGRWRLKDNISQWQIDNISSYGITFDCIEAI
ncbi:hypothetical protein UFOVP346_44 [uncultured Caudovirales phage]|uniref:Uncharacterized protein n=1 Tax=uncultured Caudovirales phage TaxID=2100421 RepID=A0A6J5M6E6_9CAUD|nr:hypothetical protein UFOVP346_44 [uncultured Caudovirales phage]